LGEVAYYYCDPSTQEAQAGGFWVWGQPGLPLFEIVLKKNNNNKKDIDRFLSSVDCIWNKASKVCLVP
jgi:hypothetical protein